MEAQRNPEGDYPRDRAFARLAGRFTAFARGFFAVRRLPAAVRFFGVRVAALSLRLLVHTRPFRAAIASIDLPLTTDVVTLATTS